jgi:hypothetical protein
VRAKSIAAVLASAAIVALCVPGVAAAHSGSAKGPAKRGSAGTFTIVTQEFELHASNGYEIGVELEDRQDLSIEASNSNLPNHSSGRVTYHLKVPQRPGSDDIRARLGNLGRFDLHFVPEKTKVGDPLCRGGHLVTETGHYVGTISFHGEDGFTRATAHRVKGTVERERLKTCPSEKPKEPKKKGVAEKGKKAKKTEEVVNEVFENVGNEGLLTVTLGGGKGSFSISRSSFKFGKKELSLTDSTVIGVRKSGRLTITSSLGSLETKGDSLTLPDPSDPAGEAIVDPPPPFSGTATFRRETVRRSKWSGDLKVDLPGFGTFPLTGHGAQTTLCVSECAKGLFSLPSAAVPPVTG